MASSTSEKFNRLINTKEQIRKAINKKGVRVDESVPFEQYANKIELIPFYDVENEETAGFGNFVTSYFTNIAGNGYQFYNNQALYQLSTADVSYLNKMNWASCLSTKYAFYNCPYLISIAPMELVSTTSCSNMFYNCPNLQSVDLTINSNLINTDYMFYDCPSLTNLTLDITTTAGSNFSSCSYMFGGKTALEGSHVALNLPKFNTLFYNNSTITSLNFLNNWKLISTNSNPTWESMFQGCPNLTDFTFPTGLIYTPPKALNNLFYSFANLYPAVMPSLQNFFDNIDLSYTTTMAQMFSYPRNNFNGLNLTITLPDPNQNCAINSMFSCDTSNQFTNTGPIVLFSFNGTGTASSIFSEYSGSIDTAVYHPKTSFGTLDLPNVTDLSYAFTYNSFLTTINQINTGLKLTSTRNMFYNCKRLTSIPLFTTTNVTNMGYMFQNCSALPTIPQFDTKNVTTMEQMFYVCTALSEIPALSTSKCSIFRNMFYNCSALTSIPAFDLGYTTNNSSWKQPYTTSSNPLYYMFYGCSNLETIHCTNIKTSLDISYSTKFTREALVEIIENLIDVGENRTLHMGSTNHAKLTAYDITIATNKGWTLN